MAENRVLWRYSVMALSDEQYARPHDYSIGSVRDQIVHLAQVDYGWFSDLRVSVRPGLEEAPQPPEFGDDRTAFRAWWDTVEDDMRALLAGLADDQMEARMIHDPHMAVWEALFHVLLHGADHRAQILALVHRLGAPTFPQDYVFWADGMLSGPPPDQGEAT
jgi:uncharacterized damage-inducible protein DinB